MAIRIYLILLTLALTPTSFAGTDFRVYKAGTLKVQRLDNKQLLQQTSSTDPCRDKISQAVCLSVASESSETKVCSEDSHQFVAPIHRIYDILPEKLKKAFCGVEHIFIEEDLGSLAYGGVQAHNESSKDVFAVIGIRKSLVENNYDATSVLGWKEQRTFGIEAPPFIHLPEGPRVEVSLPHSLSSLHYILIHELGHILDFTNGANRFDHDDYSHCKTPECFIEIMARATPALNSWATLSWKNGLTPRDDQRFPLWDKLCVYECKERLSKNDMEEFYQQLEPTNFVTAYAAISPMEDFAESFTFYVLSQNPWHYSVSTAHRSYVLENKWQALHDKKAWLDSFYKQDLKYPTPLK